MSINCEECGATLSNAATECPHCEYPTPKNQGHCRSCNATLAISEHRYKVYSDRVVDGTTSSRGSIVHIPCPNCGEPKPLRQSATQFLSANWLAIICLFPWSLLFAKFMHGIPLKKRVLIFLAVYAATAISLFTLIK